MDEKSPEEIQIDIGNIYNEILNILIKYDAWCGAMTLVNLLTHGAVNSKITKENVLHDVSEAYDFYFTGKCNEPLKQIFETQTMEKENV